jgi:hypothetical protein
MCSVLCWQNLSKQLVNIQTDQLFRTTDRCVSSGNCSLLMRTVPVWMVKHYDHYKGMFISLLLMTYKI